MKNNCYRLAALLLVELVCSVCASAQSCENMNLSLLAEVPTPCSQMTMTLRIVKH